jgi:hypothetical protein
VEWVTFSQCVREADFDIKWSIGAHVEDVPMDEMKRRMESWTKEHEKTAA